MCDQKLTIAQRNPNKVVCFNISSAFLGVGTPSCCPTSCIPITY